MKKINEGDEIKKKLDKALEKKYTTLDLLEKNNEGAKKNKLRKHSWTNVFLSLEIFGLFFLSPEINCFFSVTRGLSLMRALI